MNREGLRFPIILISDLLLWIAVSNAAVAQSSPAWAQWGQNPQHTGNVAVAGQQLQAKLSNLTFDPYVNQEIAESGALLMHYQVPLVNATKIYMEFKTGKYVSCNPPGSGKPFPCGPDAWKTEIWNERALHWQNGHLVQVWNFATDWKPVPNSGTTPSTRTLGGWEPLFQPALAGQYIYVPGRGGTVYKLRQRDGTVASHINPFGKLDPSVFVFGPLTADNAGNIYYNAIQVNTNRPWQEDVENSWLVKVRPDDNTATVTYVSLLPSAPKECLGTFGLVKAPYPWPPTANSVPPSTPCDTERPALNVAPVISVDGSTLYTASRGHRWARSSYLLAVNTADLSLQWSVSLQGLLDDGCNVLLPPNGKPGGCSVGATSGVDPTQNTLGAGIMEDTASASPVIAPDGSILLGVNTAYNYGRGHLLKFSPLGQLQANYDFGWDSTPAILPQDGTYSVVLKDNHYDNRSYCNSGTWCPQAPPGPYYITQLDSDLVPQWHYKDASTDQGHPNGFEWCVNAAAVDVNGVVYADDEDGYLYAIQQGGTPVQQIFLDRTINAGYTPVSIGGDGTVYAENAGHLIAVGQLFATTSLISSSSMNPSSYGNSVTFTAQVTSSAGVPAGTVTFRRGPVFLGKSMLNKGTAAYTTAPTQLPAGTDSVTATYQGDFTHAASTSPVFQQIVNREAAQIVVTSQPNPSAVGQQVTLTATVTAPPGIPTGNVVFRSNGTVLGTVALSSGTATLNTTFTQDGKYTIKATYQGNKDYAPSSASVAHVVQ